jgi:hypothetical protein
MSERAILSRETLCNLLTAIAAMSTIVMAETQ